MDLNREGWVRVINRNKMTVKGRYNGKDYLFKPDQPLDVPEVVAQHVFGFGLDDKTAALNRLGWKPQMNAELESVCEELGNIEFTEPPDLVEVPRIRPRGRLPGKRTGGGGPPPSVGDADGGEGDTSPPDAAEASG